MKTILVWGVRTLTTFIGEQPKTKQRVFNSRRFKLVVWKRFRDFLTLEVILSGIIFLLYNFGVMNNSDKSLGVIITFAIVIYLAANVIKMRHSFYKLKNTGLFYAGTYVGYAFFMILNLIVGYFADSKIYDALFMLTELLACTPQGVSWLVSALLFHLVLLLVIFFAPVGLYWIFLWHHE